VLGVLATPDVELILVGVLPAVVQGAPVTSFNVETIGGDRCHSVGFAAARYRCADIQAQR
jgi:hypothetical protein